MDPDYFTIKQLKEMGMWPSDKMVSPGLIPYIKRMPGERINVLIVGVKNGEDVIEILEQCPKVWKISTIPAGNIIGEGPEDQQARHREVFDKNIEDSGVDKDRIMSFGGNNEVFDNEVFDLVIIDGIPVAEVMDRYYPALKPLGIFAGSLHDQQGMKVALVSFRKPNKISVPINVAFQHIWFWVKP
jgi:hypothetical protein